MARTKKDGTKALPPTTIGERLATFRARNKDAAQNALVDAAVENYNKSESAAKKVRTQLVHLLIAFTPAA